MRNTYGQKEREDTGGGKSTEDATSHAETCETTEEGEGCSEVENKSRRDGEVDACVGSKSADFEAVVENWLGALRGAVDEGRDTLRKSVVEHAHQFEEHTYGAPTRCDICDGLLVGLWSQGVQCKLCGKNVHRGEGANGHDDCAIEALLTPCDGNGVAEEEWKSLGEAIREIKDIASTSPDFLKKVREQMDRDVMTHVKQAVVMSGVEDERTKNMKRMKAHVVLPLVQLMEEVDSKGEVYAHVLLLGLHGLFVGATLVVGIPFFAVALTPTHGIATKSTHWFACLHAVTLLFSLDAILLALAVVLRLSASIFKRKRQIIDRFLNDIFGIVAKKDLGISVDDAAVHAKRWSVRLSHTTVLSFVSVVFLWHVVQPPPLQEDAGASPGKVLTSYLVTSLVLGSQWIPLVWRSLSKPSGSRVSPAKTKEK